MHIFALETDIQRVKDKFLAKGEQEIFTVHPHVLVFILRVIRGSFITMLLLAFVIFLYQQDVLSAIAAFFVFGIAWMSFVPLSVLDALLNWRFDFLFLTTDKLIIVDQTSVFKKSILPINLENLGDVEAKTQWLNLFSFGTIHFALKEGHGPDIVLKFMPESDKLVAKISQQITLYQRRKDFAILYRPADQTIE
jgi:hypothetical protein